MDVFSYSTDYGPELYEETLRQTLEAFLEKNAVTGHEILTKKQWTKCYCLSDLHADQMKNANWVQEHCQRKSEDREHFTVFIVPGDIGSDIHKIEAILLFLKLNFDAVCYLPGNHELWTVGSTVGEGVARDCKNSFEKFNDVLQCARRNNVYVGPIRISNKNVNNSAICIIPLYSWYHSSWDTEAKLTHPLAVNFNEAFPFSESWSDFSLCHWPNVLSDHEFKENARECTILADIFAALNEPFLPPPVAHDMSTPTKQDKHDQQQQASAYAVEMDQHHSKVEGCNASNSPHTGSTEGNSIYVSDFTGDESLFYVRHKLIQPEDVVITFSHFLPRQELFPEKKFLYHSGLTEVIGSDPLEAQIRRIMPDVHLFGHTHVPIDLELEGVRYIQWPLGYKSEYDSSTAAVVTSGPLGIYNSALGPNKAGIPKDMLSLESRWSKHYKAHPRITRAVAAAPNAADGKAYDDEAYGDVAADWADEDIAEVEAQAAVDDLAPHVIDFFTKKLAQAAKLNATSSAGGR